MGNRLPVFSAQLCFALHAESHYWSIENLLYSWTWAFLAAARPRAMPGASTARAHCDQFGTRHSKPTFILHSPPRCTNWLRRRARPPTRRSSCGGSAGTRASEGPGLRRRRHARPR
eukprot:6710175-Pyramimonas_sp.AAC.2